MGGLWRHSAPLLLRLALAVLLVGAPVSSAAAQSNNRCPPGQLPQFVFGFADLRARIGSAMGNAETCEFADPNGTGDVHQRTNTGLAFWRKSTNTPTFTDGYNHWTLTASGLVTWTGASIDPPGVTPPPGAPPAPPREVTGRPEDCLAVEESGFINDLPRTWLPGYEVVQGTVRNKCYIPVGSDAAVKLANLSLSPGGAAAVDLSRAIVGIGRLEPGSGRKFQIPVNDIKPSSGPYYMTFEFGRITVTGLQDLGIPCWTVDANACIAADARLAAPIGTLLQYERGRWLLSVASQWGVDIQVDHMPVGVYGSYRPAPRTIRIDDRLLTYGFREVAAILAHELQHAADDAAGKLGTGAICYLNEEDAFRREGELWLASWNGQLPPSQNSVQAELNDIAIAATRDPYRLISTYLAGYGHECGG
jgi:hypothetical protein